jgi:hypothetical protein
MISRSVTRYNLLAPAELLPRVLDEAKGGVVIFDLDSTLLDNRPRQARILTEFGHLHGFPEARPEHFDSWDLTRAMKNAGIVEAEKYSLEFRRFWRERFFTSEYCEIDDAIAGAVEFAARVREVAIVAYCTGRHEAMRAGTEKSFARLGFPLPGENVHLFMKPRIDIHDDDYKVTACDELRALGRVAAAFDNEPTHINIYRRAFPEAMMIHMATDHSQRPVELEDGIVSIARFS